MVRHVSSSKLITKTINRSTNTLLPIQQTHYTGWFRVNVRKSFWYSYMLNVIKMCKIIFLFHISDMNYFRVP